MQLLELLRQVEQGPAQGFDPLVVATYALVIATLGIVIIGVFTGRDQRRSNAQSVAALERAAVAQERAASAMERGAELQVLLKLFETLSTIELYRARANIFKYYCAVYGSDRSESADKRKKLLTMYFAIKEDVRKVEGAFDQAGVLVMQKKVDQKLFFELYALMVIRTYRALQAHIEERQKQNPAFALWFSKLFEEALIYYRTELQREPEEIYCDRLPS